MCHSYRAHALELVLGDKKSHRSEKPVLLNLFIYLIGVQLIYNVVLVLGVHQNDLVTHGHISIFFRLFSHIGYYEILSRVTCAIQ